VRIDDEFAGDAGVEGLVALSGFGGLTDDAVSAYGLAMKIEHAKIQINVTIEIQLTVRAAGSAS
jgi:hypothetical protein